MLEKQNSKRGNKIALRLIIANSSYHYNSWQNNNVRSGVTRKKDFRFCWFIIMSAYRIAVGKMCFIKRGQNVSLDTLTNLLIWLHFLQILEWVG